MDDEDSKFDVVCANYNTGKQWVECDTDSNSEFIKTGGSPNSDFITTFDGPGIYSNKYLCIDPANEEEKWLVCGDESYQAYDTEDKNTYSCSDSVWSVDETNLLIGSEKYFTFYPSSTRNFKLVESGSQYTLSIQEYNNNFVRLKIEESGSVISLRSYSLNSEKEINLDTQEGYDLKITFDKITGAAYTFLLEPSNWCCSCCLSD